MYTELWNLCAGPLVTVPKVGDKVYYFPQGHIEQVSTNQPRSLVRSRAAGVPGGFYVEF
jgi:hypothetical protein